MCDEWEGEWFDGRGELTILFISSVSKRKGQHNRRSPWRNSNAETA